MSLRPIARESSGAELTETSKHVLKLPVLKETLQTSANALSIMSGYKSARVKPMGSG